MAGLFFSLKDAAAKTALDHARERHTRRANATTMDEKYEALLLVCLAIEPLACRPSRAKHSVSCARVCVHAACCAHVRHWPHASHWLPSQRQHMLSFLWATFETGIRGFLLGFGVMVCKEVMCCSAVGDVPVPCPAPRPQEGDKEDTQTPRTAHVVLPPDFSHMFARAKVAGLGVGCLIVGASLLLPASLRQKMLAA